MFLSAFGDRALDLFCSAFADMARGRMTGTDETETKQDWTRFAQLASLDSLRSNALFERRKRLRRGGTWSGVI